MKDLTPLQAVKQLRKLFPEACCVAEDSYWKYTHLTDITKRKRIYVSSNKPSHLQGGTYRELIIQAIEVSKNPSPPVEEAVVV